MPDRQRLRRVLNYTAFVALIVATVVWAYVSGDTTVTISPWLFGLICVAVYAVIELDHYFVQRIIKEAMDSLAARSATALEVSREARLALETLTGIEPERAELIELGIQELRAHDAALQREVEIATLIGSGASLWTLQRAYRRAKGQR